MELEHIDRTLAFKWYKIDGAKAKFGNVESEVVNYVFLQDKFYGKVCAIVGKDNINELLRYFSKELERIYEEQAEMEVFKQPVELRDRSYAFIKPDEVIIVKRFSVHLGEVQIICRDLFEKHIGLFEEGQ